MLFAKQRRVPTRIFFHSLLTNAYTFPCMKKTSIYDIAKRVGVSAATVSYVLNGKEGKVSPATKKKVFQAMEELGYTRDHAAVSLSTGKSHLIGLILPYSSPAKAFLFNPFYAEFLGFFEEILKKEGYDVIIGSDEEGFEQWYKSRALDAVMVLGSLSKKAEQTLLKVNAKVVLADVYESYDAPFPNVRFHDEKAEYLATRHLISLGHKSIGYLGGPDTSIVNHKRFCGYEKALMEYDYPIPKDCIFRSMTTLEGGYQMGDLIQKKLNRISAIVVDADIVAIGLIRRLLELGVKLPDQLSIVGFDDIQPAQYIFPPLTTIHQDIKEKATLSARAILDEVKGTVREECSFIIEPSLTVRSSTAKRRQ